MAVRQYVLAVSGEAGAEDEVRGVTGMHDRVFLEGLAFYGFHGVNPEERRLGQRFVVDVSIEADLRVAGETDDLARTVSYSAVYRVVRGIVEGPSHQLIETVAERIGAALLEAFPRALGVTVTVRKPHAPIEAATFDAAGVTIHRTRREVDRE
jgi:7,8-dihydroneopterin aldolase/epimerase/oxygenase